MRIFLATVEEGNFTRAALRENISQPAATIIINEIEATIGQELFIRQGTIRRAALTNTGKSIAETFSRIVASYDRELGRISANNRGKRTTKRVLIQAVYADALNMNWLFALINPLAGNRLVVEEESREQIIAKINAREADLGLIDGEVDHEHCDSKPIANFTFGLAIPADWDLKSDANGIIGWPQLPPDFLLLDGIGASNIRNISRNLIAAGRSIEDAHMVNGTNTLHKLVRHNPIPVILPDILFPRLRDQHKYRFLRLSPSELQSSFAVVTPWGYINQINLDALRSRTCFG
jgi:DNA-binding transcriptional LysR family regulator